MIDPAKIKELQMGKTKTLEVEQLLGKPDKVEPLAGDEVKYTYDYCKKEPMIFAMDPNRPKGLKSGSKAESCRLTSSPPRKRKHS